MKLIDIFSVAHQMELRGMEFYSAQCGNVKLPQIKEIFEHLVIMEKDHAEYLHRQIEKLERSETPELPEAGDKDNLFIERMTAQKLDSAKLTSDLGDFSVVRMAYLIEKDFVVFYENSAGGQTDKVVKMTFEMLAAWERGHAEMLKKQLEGIIERNALDLGFYPL